MMREIIIITPFYTAGIIKITWLGLSKGGQMSLHVEQQEYSYIYTSM